jgi:RND family efflux transporter MFP subunit
MNKRFRIPFPRMETSYVLPRQRVLHATTLLLLAVCIVSVLAHEGHRPLPTRGIEIDTDTGRMVLTKAARETLDVQTTEAMRRPVSQSVMAYGTLISPWNRHAMVSSPLSGRIVKLFVTPGESVQAGQKLAELDSPELELLQLELLAAKTAIDLSVKLVESTEKAIVNGAIPQIRFVEAKNKLEQDRIRLEVASAKWLGLQLSQESLDELLSRSNDDHRHRLALSSPIDGVVTHADLSVGKVVDPKEHLFEVLDLSTIWLKISVLEKDLARVMVGQAVDLSLTAWPDETFTATVDVLGQFLDPQTHLGTVWATLSNSSSGEPRLLPGMSGQVQLRIDDRGEKLTLPLSAVIRDGAERFVLVEEEQTKVASTFQKQTVALGTRMGDLIEVRGGSVFPADRVVTRGSHELGGFFTKGVLKVSEETARDIDLTLETVNRHSLAETITIDGLVDVPPTLRSTAAAQLRGSIASILVDRGQKVSQGDLLAEIVSQDFQNLQLEFLKASLDARLLQSIMDNLRLVDDAVSQRRLWETESQLNQAINQRENAAQRLKTVGLTEGQIADLLVRHQLIPTLPVRAPIDGVIMDFDKVLGHVVRPEESLFEIHDLSQVWVQGFVSERDLPDVRVGHTVRVRFVADSSEAVPGTLVRSSRAVGREDRTLSVWVELQQMPRVPMQHNMLARLTIETGRTSSQLAVPRAAVIREGTRAFVFLRKDDGVFERRFVQLGRSDDTRIEIREGLTEGESIAVGGALQLQTGYAALR